MSVSGSHMKLSRAGKGLLAGWQRIRETWRDENARQFEKKYLAPLQTELRMTQMAMEHIDAMISHLQSDCK